MEVWNLTYRNKISRKLRKANSPICNRGERRTFASSTGTSLLFGGFIGSAMDSMGEVLSDSMKGKCLNIL